MKSNFSIGLTEEGQIEIKCNWEKPKTQEEEVNLAVEYAKLVCGSIKEDIIPFIQESLKFKGDDVAKRILYFINRYMEVVNKDKSETPLICPTHVFKVRND